MDKLSEILINDPQYPADFKEIFLNQYARKADFVLKDERLPIIPCFFNSSIIADLQILFDHLFAMIEKCVMNLDQIDQKLIEERLGIHYGKFHQSFRDNKDDWRIFMRPDFLLDTRSQTAIPKIMEFNITSRIGGVHESHQYYTLFNTLPVFREFMEQYRLSYIDPLEKWVQQIVKTYTSKKNAECKTIAIVEKKGDIAAERATYEGLATGIEKFSNLKTFITYPESFRTVNHDLYLDNEKIDCIFRIYPSYYFKDPVHYQNCQPLINAIESGAVFLIGKKSILISEKIVLAWLTSKKYSHLYSDQEKTLIQKYIPQTALLYPQDQHCEFEMNELIRRKDYYVIKKNVSSGGRNLHFGKTMDEKTWKETLSFLRLDPNDIWLIQEYIKPEESELPFLINNEVQLHRVLQDYGVFVFDKQISGVFKRITNPFENKNTTNLHANGGFSPVYFFKNY